MEEHIVGWNSVLWFLCFLVMLCGNCKVEALALCIRLQSKKKTKI